MYLSDSVARRMLKDAGAARVSKDAVKEFKKYADRASFDVAQKAVKLACHAGRKTVDVSDVRLATD